ncbi:MAG: hypothetical protein HUJ98_13195, partial [Bacteroidaceae bacterium]|nr:hypothetical protein [Bacteroidaceae bacterium]
HSIEDDDTHFCTGSGLGHYFRGLEGQDYSGIDVIGGQVIPQGEDEPTQGLMGPRNGGFYHYTLAKLASSFAYLDESKQGRAMCEIFGNYGWKSGVYEQKYLADHCLVRGINNFVPHAFSPKAYPDSDCPPHFYAHGHNPQYRAFGQLCRYMNRVADLISRGKPVVSLAIWYNAESDWAGECMSLDKPARELYDSQMDYIFLPSDYRNRAGEFKYVIVPEADFAPQWLAELENAVFINSIPKNLSQVKGQVVMLEELADFLKANQARDAVLEPANNRIRVLHYKGEQELYMAVNEGTSSYQGRMSVSSEGEYKAYDPWSDCFVDVSLDDLNLGARKSLIFIKDAAPEVIKDNSIPEKQVKLTQFTRSICKGIDYPKFEGTKLVALPDDVSKEDKMFSGFVRYETRFSGFKGQKTVIKVTEPAEAIEVFVNGKSCGIQIVPDYIFDVTEYVCDGENSLTMEMATTLGRENSKSFRAKFMGGKDEAPTGITGEVYLCQE